MSIYFKDQNDSFPKHLNRLKKQELISYNKESLEHKTSTRFINRPFSSIQFDDFFNYQIFPESILKPYPEWVDENRKILVGDTIVQQIQLPPINVSVKMILGVRISSTIDSITCKSFSYETIEGHLEKGISKFTLEPYNEGSIFKIETYSEPTLPILKAFKPFSILYQSYCTKSALQNTASKLL